MVEKNDIKISEEFRKVFKKFLYKGSTLVLLGLSTKQVGLIITKNAIDVAQKMAILKNIFKINALFLKNRETELGKK